VNENGIVQFGRLDYEASVDGLSFRSLFQNNVMKSVTRKTGQ